MRLVAQLAQARIDERARSERQPHLHLGAAVGVEREELVQQAGRRRERIGLLRQRRNPVRDPPDDKLHGEVQEVGLRLEVVAQRSDGPARLGGHPPQGGGFDSVAHDDTPQRGGELLAAGDVVDDLRHYE